MWELEGMGLCKGRWERRKQHSERVSSSRSVLRRMKEVEIQKLNPSCKSILPLRSLYAPLVVLNQLAFPFFHLTPSWGKKKRGRKENINLRIFFEGCRKRRVWSLGIRKILQGRGLGGEEEEGVVGVHGWGRQGTTPTPGPTKVESWDKVSSSGISTLVLHFIYSTNILKALSMSVSVPGPRVQRPLHSLSSRKLYQLLRTQGLHWGALASHPPCFPANTSPHPPISPHHPPSLFYYHQKLYDLISSRHCSVLSNADWVMP